MSKEFKVPLADTHCHLDFDQFESDLDQVLARAWEVGLTRILVPGIDVLSSMHAIELAESDPRIYAAVGVHPNSAKTWDSETLDSLRRMAEHPKVVAVGEIGLDYYRDHAPHDLQKEILQTQLKLALEMALPVVIHNRDASSDLLPVLLSWQTGLAELGSSLASRPGVLHSFSGEADVAKEGIEAHFFIGITGPVTFKNTPDLQEAVGDLPLNRLLIETDAPFLAPHPNRGRRNEPAYVRLVAEKIADLHDQPFEEVARRTTENATQLFGW